MRTATQEDYLKKILELEETTIDPMVSFGKLAEALSLAPGTVTSMVKKLAASGLVWSQAYTGCKLTAEGRALAMDILRRHRIIELFLVDVIGLDWSDVHEEAERLEHAVSPRVLEGLETYLGNPRTDPHGRPIPTSKGTFESASKHQSLSECPEGISCRISQILDESKQFLQYLGSIGLYPETCIRIIKVEPEAGIISVRPENHEPAVLGFPVADKILVTELNQE